MVRFEKLYRDNYLKVFFYLNGLCQDTHLAEDLAQETFYKALTYLCSRQNVTICTKWLITLAHHTFIDAMRKNRIRPESLSSQEDAAPAVSVDLAERMDLIHALNNLPLRYKSIILLKDHYGFSLEEIAQLTGCTLSAAKVALFRARNKVREVYGQHGQKSQHKQDG